MSLPGDTPAFDRLLPIHIRIIQIAISWSIVKAFVTNVLLHESETNKPLSPSLYHSQWRVLWDMYSLHSVDIANTSVLSSLPPRIVYMSRKVNWNRVFWSGTRLDVRAVNQKLSERRRIEVYCNWRLRITVIGFNLPDVGFESNWKRFSIAFSNITAFCPGICKVLSGPGATWCCSTSTPKKSVFSAASQHFVEFGSCFFKEGRPFSPFSILAYLLKGLIVA